MNKVPAIIKTDPRKDFQLRFSPRKRAERNTIKSRLSRSIAATREASPYFRAIKYASQEMAPAVPDKKINRVSREDKCNPSGEILRVKRLTKMRRTAMMVALIVVASVGSISFRPNLPKIATRAAEKAEIKAKAIHIILR
jgi:hypothetical protein